MEITVRTTRKVNVSAVNCVLPVNDEDVPSNYPHRNGDIWDITIEISTGQIRDWPDGVAHRSVPIKVTDGGTYRIIGDDGGIVAALTDDFPSWIPNEFEINERGKILNWMPDLLSDIVLL